MEREEGDNESSDAAPTDVSVPPLTNLTVTSVTPPLSATLGEVTTFQWQLETTIAENANGRWFDSLFLSADATWDVDDAFVGRFEVDPGTLAQGAPFTASGAAPIPAVRPGDYHVIARTDVFNQIPETAEDDNEAASVATMTMTAILLVLDAVTEEGTVESALEAAEERYFEMSVPAELAGKTVRVRLEHDSAQAWTELYVSFEAVPTPGLFDFRFDSPAAPIQEVTIPELQEGKYFILAKALASAGTLVPNTMRVVVAVLPFAVEDAAPTTIGNQGRVTIEVTGSQFKDGASVKLVPTASGVPIAARWTRRLDSTRLLAKFVLDPLIVKLGPYRLEVTNPGGESGELASDVTVEAAVPPTLDVTPADPPALRQGAAAGNVDCIVTNSGNVDAEYVFLLHVLEQLDSREVLRVLASSALTSSRAADGFFIESAVIPSLLPGERAVLTTTVRAGVDSEGSIALGQGAAVFNTQEFLELQEAVAAEARQAVLADPTVVREEEPDQALIDAGDASTWRGAWFDRLQEEGLVDAEDVSRYLLGLRLVVAPQPSQSDDCFPSTTLETLPPFCDTLGSQLCDAWLLHSLQLSADVRDFVPEFSVGGVEVDDFDPALRAECAGGAGLCGSCIDWSVLRSVDPNEKIGTEGFGNARFVSLSAPLAYRVYFQNEPDATAPAATVVITDPLDPALSSGSVRLGAIAFADLVVDVPDDSLTFQTRLDLTEERGIFLDITAGVDASAGEVFWILRSNDPATGEPPTDGSIGFLPPDDDEGSGSGWVEYNAVPLTVVAAGTVVENGARVQFDVNEPLDTATVLNTVDADAPLSQMAPLDPLQGDSTFVISWDGGDVAGGSGVSGYTIYLSVDDGPFVPLVSDTTGTQRIFAGEPGRQYAFYSIATDNVGNREDPPRDPQAITTTPGQPPFRRGDSNSDANVDIADSLFTLLWLFAGGPAPVCLDATDTNDDGALNVTDPIYALQALFANGSAIPAPGVLECGIDPTDDTLEICVYTAELCSF